MSKSNISKIKPFILPAAMILGALFHAQIGRLAPLMPYLIALMLFITYCRIDLKKVRLTRFSLWLTVVQIGGGIAAYFLFRPFGEAVAQGVMICMMCPVATAAPVVTAMLGGNIERVMTFSLASNLAVAVIAPLLFAYVGQGGDVSFLSALGAICLKVLPLLLLPLLAALAFRSITPKACAVVANHQSLSFYIWSVALTIVMARAFDFFFSEPGSARDVIFLAVASLVVCCILFYVGHKIGSHYNDDVAGTQSLGQKNTILALWMSFTFLNPVSSVGPAAYIIWQNIINTAQIFRFTRHGQHI